MSPKRFRIAFSFAGEEKRPFVKEVADILAKRFGQEDILYDKYHEAEFANADLAFDLPSLYKHDTDLIVSVFCTDYDKKEWCGLEWRAIFSMIKEGDTKQIMLARFDHTDGKGLHGLAGFIELDNKTPEQFATLILERLAINESRPRDYYTALPPQHGEKRFTPIPHNLPRLQPFYGRQRDLAVVEKALASSCEQWGIIIEGQGGMGKTSLAIRAALSLPPGRFQRIVFLSAKQSTLDSSGERSLRGFSHTSWADMLSEIARHIGQADIAKAIEAERPRLLCAALSSQFVLLILDNLEALTHAEHQDILTFLDHLPQGCKAILTARLVQTTLPNTHTIQPLDESSVRAMIADLTHGNPLVAKIPQSAIDGLMRHTRSNPLLLRWIIGQVGHGSCRDLEAAVALAREARSHNDPLEFVFGDLLPHLGSAEVQVLATLSYPSQPIPTVAVAEISGLNVEETQQALRSLANRSLILSDQAEEKHALISMIGDFLRKKKPEVLAETGKRLEQRAFALIMENGYRHHDRFSHLENNWHSIAPAFEIFLNGDNDRLQHVCAALWVFLNFEGHWDEWLSLSERAETVAKNAGDFFEAGWRALQAGRVHRLRQNAKDLVLCLARVQEHWFNSPDAALREWGNYHCLRGKLHYIQTDYIAAIDCFRQAQSDLEGFLHENSCRDPQLARETKINIAGVLNGLGDCYRLTLKFENAASCYHDALSLAEDIRYDEGVAFVTGNLSALALDQALHGEGQNDVMQRMELLKEAENLARQSLDLAEAIQRKELVAHNSHRLAKSLYHLGDRSLALEYAQRAVDGFPPFHPNLTRAQETLAHCMEALG